MIAMNRAVINVIDSGPSPLSMTLAPPVFDSCIANYILHHIYMHQMQLVLTDACRNTKSLSSPDLLMKSSNKEMLEKKPRKCKEKKRKHTYIHTYIHTYKHTNIHTYIRIYIHTYVYTYIPTNKQTNKQENDVDG
jgi:hypothetical protein